MGGERDGEDKGMKEGGVLCERNRHDDGETVSIMEAKDVVMNMALISILTPPSYILMSWTVKIRNRER